MSVKTTPGVYLIRCRENGALYVGSAKNLRARLQGHLSKLKCGGEDVELLQDDWNGLGMDAFEFKVLHLPLERIEWLERELTLLLGALEQHGGYNRKLGGRWGLAARFRDTERKFQRNGLKYVMLPNGCYWARINPVLLRTFCQESSRLSDELVRQYSADERADPKSLNSYLNSFMCVDPRDLSVSYPFGGSTEEHLQV